MLRQHSRRLALETLEDRSLLAAGILDNGWLGVLGTKGNDNIQVEMSGGYIRVNDNGVVRSFSGVPTVAILCLAGDDQITVDDNVTIPVWVDGGKGNDTIQLGSGNDVVIAGAGNDTLRGGAGDDFLFGEAGDDNVWGDGGIDVASGGRGNDVVHGGDGDDFLGGDAGHDEVYGELGNDLCDGAAGNDLLSGGVGFDEMMGGSGLDLIFGGDDDDLIDGGRGKDECYGGAGDDRLKGGAGLDRLDGEAGNNLLDKDQGRDVLANGIEADLDQVLRANFQEPGGATGTVNYELMNDNGTLQAKFTLQIQNAPSNTTLNVVINKVTIGQVVTDGSGNGELQFSTTPSGNELPFPTGFPSVRENSKIKIGNTLQGKLVRAYFVSRPIPLPDVA